KGGQHGDVPVAPVGQDERQLGGAAPGRERRQASLGSAEEFTRRAKGIPQGGGRVARLLQVGGDLVEVAVEAQLVLGTVHAQRIQQVWIPPAGPSTTEC